MKEELTPYMRERMEMYQAGALDVLIAKAQCVEVGTIVAWRRRRGRAVNTDRVNITRCGHCEKYHTLDCRFSPDPEPSDFCSRARRKR